MLLRVAECTAAQLCVWFLQSSELQTVPAVQPDATACRNERIPYGGEVDVWSAGCIFVELLMGYPLYTFEQEIDLIFQIFKDCGTPDVSKWPDVAKLPAWDSVRKGSSHSVIFNKLNNLILQKRPVRFLRFLCTARVQWCV